MLKCIEVVHKLGIVHCDLKPANFVLFKGRLKLVDFGIASEASSTESHMKGSLSYMPPEVRTSVSFFFLIPCLCSGV